MGKTSLQPDLFSYRDYRLFLRNWYDAQKKTRRAFSHRAFAKQAGFQSSNFLLLVMEGKRNLTEASLSKIMLGLKLNKQEQDFFKNLVYFTQAKKHEEKDFFLQNLLRSRKFNQLKPIEKDQYEYYSTWYHPIVRELVASKMFDGNVEWIVKKISPAITTSQVEKSIELLEKLGFIKKNATHKWAQSSSLVSTGPEVQSHLVHNYHKIILDLSKEVLDQVPHSRRDISTMTLGIAKERIPQLKKKIQEFRRDILKLVSTDNDPEDVVQLNIQLFPLTVSEDQPEEEI